jgi:hypothetical protein
LRRGGSWKRRFVGTFRIGTRRRRRIREATLADAGNFVEYVRREKRDTAGPNRGGETGILQSDFPVPRKV